MNKWQYLVSLLTTTTKLLWRFCAFKNPTTTATELRQTTHLAASTVRDSMSLLELLPLTLLLLPLLVMLPPAPVVVADPTLPDIDISKRDER